MKPSRGSWTLYDLKNILNLKYNLLNDVLVHWCCENRVRHHDWHSSFGSGLPRRLCKGWLQMTSPPQDSGACIPAITVLTILQWMQGIIYSCSCQHPGKSEFWGWTWLKQCEKQKNRANLENFGVYSICKAVIKQLWPGLVADFESQACSKKEHRNEYKGSPRSVKN